MTKHITKLMLGLSLIFSIYSCSKDSPGDTPEPEPPIISPNILQYPAKEMRAVWLTTAWGLDWPLGDYTVAGQRQKYLAYLDKFQEMNINTIFFQVRAMGDAYYVSDYEPWATSITGIRGKDPGYDILKFLIDEAHARGIEFHAWMNPYRIATRANNGTAYPPLHSSIDPSWVVSHEKIQIYNPAREEVRKRIADIVKELITKYNVDGVHLDDYFYPDPSSAGAMVSDQADYEAYGTGFSSIEAWRRANVDKAIEGIHDAIVATKPEVVFSISPAASRAYNLNTLYADVAKWCQEGWLDLLIPQLYQEIGNSVNDFQTNLGVWTQFAYAVPVVIGHGYYRFGDPAAPAAFQSTAELEKQMNMAKRNAKVVGSAMYSARYITDNKIGITNKLQQLYTRPGVMPFLGRSSASAPAVPSNIRINGNQLVWNTSGDVRTVVYYFPPAAPGAVREGEVLAITAGTSLNITKAGGYSLTTLDADHQESNKSDVIEKQ